MPIYKHLIISHETSISIWHISESLETISKGIVLKDTHRAKYENIKSITHQKSFWSVRKLLEFNGFSDLDLHYSDNGKPLLSKDISISISHSFDFSTVIISKYQVGIDIEMIREKIVRIASKFAKNELDYLQKNDKLAENLTIIWSVKEAVYKLGLKKSIHFNNEIFVSLFEDNINEGRVRISLKENNFSLELPFYIIRIENYILTYVIVK